MPATQPFREIKERGYTSDLNLLYRYLNQDRAEASRPVTTPQHGTRLLLTKPENLRSKDTELRDLITAAGPQMTELARLVTTFASLLTPTAGNDTKLTLWISDVHAADLPHMHSFCNGLGPSARRRDRRLTKYVIRARTALPLRVSPRDGSERLHPRLT